MIYFNEVVIMEIKNYYYKLTDPDKKYFFKVAPRGYGKRVWRRELRKRKFKMFLKKRLWWISAVLIVAVVFGLFFISNSLSEELRGYEGVGGEIFILFLPVALILGRDLLHDLLDIFK